MKLALEYTLFGQKNLKFRIFSNLHRCCLDKIFRNENVKDKIGEISKETIAMHLNSSI